MTVQELSNGRPGTEPDFALLSQVEGWLCSEAADLTARIARFQKAHNWVTGVLELGVFKGKYLSLLAALFQENRVPVVGVDAWLARVGVQCSEMDQQAVMLQIVETVRTIAPRSVEPKLLAAFTSALQSGDLLSHCPDGYSFISVDAGHEAEAVEHDMGLAEAVMRETSVIAADDVFNHKVPGVAEGTFRYLLRNQSKLAPFALCGNKVFYCHRSTHRVYLDHMVQILNEGGGVSYVAKTKSVTEQNANLSFQPRILGMDVVPFEWN